MRYLLPLLTLLAILAGCDLLDPAKVGDPVFGPPPPRKVVKAGTDAPSKTADTAVVSPEAAPAAPEATNNVAATTTRGSSPDNSVTQAAATFEADAKHPAIKIPDKKMSGNEIIASINGQPLFASEIFERAATEPLTREGLSLIVAARAMAAGQLTEHEYTELQVAAIHKFGKDYVRTRVLAQAMMRRSKKSSRRKSKTRSARNSRTTSRSSRRTSPR